MRIWFVMACYALALSGCATSLERIKADANCDTVNKVIVKTKEIIGKAEKICPPAIDKGPVIY